ncbi:MAG: Unknown protein [uncultured Thiotrichaceae bacterium]|uniref:SPOR domain-containing protein n=1 Tax=uncultured Thiotrichaceae bacterium TaxID=298394 RepID=A0A6S6S6L6_9GAMM|nr:MAG: Unknown protein [uncultured Thiotrichaceae bacterium]
MTRDFKQNKSNATPNQYGLSWVLGGIAVGLLAGGLVYAYMSNQVNTGNSTETATGAEIPPPSVSETNNPALQDTPEKDTRPGFIYHAVLPQLEVDVPIPAPQETAPANQEPIEEPVLVEEEAAEAQVAAVQEAQSNIAKGRYMFQLGAYQSQAQAIQMQRRAQQNGMNTRIETANINGKTWFRVRLGPTDNLQTVNIWKQRLSGMGINPMMIRL